MGDIAIVHADGTVTTIYDRAASEGFSYFTGGGETNTNARGTARLKRALTRPSRSDLSIEAAENARLAVHFHAFHISTAGALAVCGPSVYSQEVALRFFRSQSWRTSWNERFARQFQPKAARRNVRLRRLSGRDAIPAQFVDRRNRTLIFWFGRAKRGMRRSSGAFLANCVPSSRTCRTSSGSSIQREIAQANLL
jgi:hypothetical protein